MLPSVLGLDIGGANLKAAHSSGAARLVPFQLWKHPARLAAALRSLIAPFPAYDQLAVTMTGELCDCYETRSEGVQAILDAVQTVTRKAMVRVWLNDGRLVSLAKARRVPHRVASANWLALATVAGRLAPGGAALLIDVGSTTTDLIPIVDGVPAPLGRTDATRFKEGELEYSGVRRTPVCAVLGDGSVAAELFATTLDAYLVLGKIAEDPADHDTADGRPATVAAARARLARMLLRDPMKGSRRAASDLARQVFDCQRRSLQLAIDFAGFYLPGDVKTVILAGSGEFLARAALARSKAAKARRVSLARLLGADVSAAACAYALAVLAAGGGDPGLE